uniref:RNase H type-1 domain-containing protein n=1 Tax=Cannabis sativa TaxID=3483 RepID=A0A803Q0J4_CANSA
MDYLYEYRQANTPPAKPPQSSQSRSQPWLPPPKGLLKLNVDAALDVDNQTIGVGSIVRNSYGQVIAAILAPIKGVFSVKEIEAKAISYCLKWLHHINCSVHLIETDALTVSQNVNNPQQYYSYFYDLVRDIIYQMSYFPSISLRYVYRSVNSAVHGLARFALRIDTEIV